jgi:hypothetical protein
MMYKVQSKVIKGEKKDVIYNVNGSHITESLLTVSQLKALIKTNINILEHSEIEKEVLYFGSKEKKDENEIVELVSGLEYNVFIKQ